MTKTSLLKRNPLHFSKLIATPFIVTLATLLAACQPADNSESSIASTLININETTLASAPSDFSAHWLAPQLVLLAHADPEHTYQLSSQENNALLTPTVLPEWVKTKHPHLANFHAFTNNVSPQQAKQWLKKSIFVAAINNDKKVDHIAHIQSGELLDALYTQSNEDADDVNDYGATIQANGVQFKLWAPTATKVTIGLFNADKSAAEPASLTMAFDENTGAWLAQGNSDLVGKYYQYTLDVFHPASGKVEQITTTDPYSLSLSTNSVYSQIVDLNNKNTQPIGWLEQTIEPLTSPEDAILYEVHIRDFSSADEQLSNTGSRGKYAAFSENNSDGINHLKSLKNAGLNHIHLLPTFDIGTVNEDAAQTISLSSTLSDVCQIAAQASVCQTDVEQTQTLGDLLASFNPLSADAQQLVSELRPNDNYNWGYDPFHYTVPEGSYAINPEGEARIIEFRQMVQSLHNMGFRVVMDVVYNHTHQARLEPTAVLDKIVPNYYQRLHPITGDIEQSTCCDNTATERKMMEKLMIDSLVVWARDYKIDGFRFDLMAHQPKLAMLKAREIVREFDTDTYFYGEGWNFGEVANNAQFVQASQLALAGTEIGTFTDRLRDAVRGPGISVSGDDIRRNQGIGNGLVTLPNELQQQENAPNGSLLMDQLRIGLAGNLANFPLENAQGELVTGKDIPYGNQPTGYALDPADTINYVSKHDNQTLWDNNQYRNAFDLTIEQRVRLHNQSLSYALLAQGIPFLHMGSEFLRSKSFLRDSYDYSDWYNRVDFSGKQNFYHVGLPPAEKDQENWPLIEKLLSENNKRDMAKPENIAFASNIFKEFMAIRMSSPLFRLTTADEIIQRVSFKNTGVNQANGLIVMHINDTETETMIDKQYQQIVVVFNSNASEINVTFETKGFALHPIQARGVDQALTKSALIKPTNFVVPALTTAVFVQPRQQ